MYWKSVKGKCEPEVKVEVLPKLECPPTQIHPLGPCDLNTGRQPIEIVKNRYEDCKCQYVGRTLRDRPCRK